MADAVTTPLADLDPAIEPPTKKAKINEVSEGQELPPDGTNLGSSETTKQAEQAEQNLSGEKSENAKLPVVQPAAKQFRGAVVETDVGITQYIGESKGFSGILKQRFSDFLVNEIDIQGKVVRLTDINKPGPQNGETVAGKSGPSVLTEEWKVQLQMLLDNKDLAGKVEMLVGDDKQVRSDIHAAIRDNYTDLHSTTEQKDGKKYITVVYKTQRSRDDRRPQWPAGCDKYCKFTLYKENKDTMEAIRLLAKMLRLNSSMFAFAGTKDKRGKTCQQVTICKVPGARLHQLNSGLRGMALGNIRYCKKPLKLGDLSGNHFIIILRCNRGYY